MAAHRDSNSELPLAVVALDFGTTYSGYAYSFRSEYQKASKARSIFHNSWTSGMAGNNSTKAPTVALFNPDKEFDSFGYEAEEKFSDLTEEKTHSEWYYFSKFKMQLFDKMTLSPDLATSDQSGKYLPAIEVFSESIKYLVKAAVKQIEEVHVSEKDITWVLTVPAIWNEPAKQFMREAAIKAGIDEDKLMLALEPEAAAIYCRYLPTTLNGKDENDILSFLHKGGRYMVVDMGGGTVDIAVHEVSDDGNRLVEIIPVSGGAWGGDTVNQSFINFLDKKIGETKRKRIKQTRTSHWMKFERNFEATKRRLKINNERAIRIDVPPVIIAEAQLDITFKDSFKFDIRNEDFRSFFDSTKHVISHMKDILNRVADVELILMVGGYVQSDYVSTLIKREFPSKTVMVPTKAEVAVVEGAVMFGFDPLSVSARMCRHTYGIGCHRDFKEGFHREEYRKDIDGEDQCNHIFGKVATEGDILEITEKRVAKFSSSHKDESRRNITMNFRFYASTDKSCQYTTDSSCKHIGNIELSPPDDGWPEKVHYRVEMYFGRTEFEVKVFNDTDEREYNAKFDFLIEQEVPKVLPRSPAPAPETKSRTPAQETKSRCTLC